MHITLEVLIFWGYKMTSKVGIYLIFRALLGGGLGR